MEFAALGWVHWFDYDRPHDYLGDVPPIEFEAAHAARQTDQQVVEIQ